MKEKWYWRLAYPLISIAYLSFVGRLIYAVWTGHGNEHYISGAGYKLTPIGVLVFLLCIPFVLAFLKFQSYQQKKLEKDFLEKYGKNDKDENSDNT